MKNLSKRQGYFSLFNIKQVIFACAVMFCAMGVFGADYTWTGGGVDNQWITSENWGSPSGYPAGAADRAIFGGNATVAAPSTFTIGEIQVNNNSTVSISSGTLNVTTIGGNGSLTIQGNLDSISSANLGSLTVEGTSTISGNITTTGNQTYTGAVTLNGHTSLTATGQKIEFGSTVVSGGATLGTHYSLTVEAGTIVHNGLIGDDIGIPADNIDSLNEVSLTATSISLSGSVRTIGTQSYTGPVEISSTGEFVFNAVSEDILLSNSFTGAGVGTSSFRSAAGTITFGGAVSGFTTFQVGAAAVINGGVTTTGLQDYDGTVTVGGDIELNAGSANIDFTSTINGANSLTLNTSGVVTFGGNVGNSTQLSSLDVTAGTINTGSSTTSITTTGDQTYNGTVTSIDGVNFYPGGNVSFFASGNSLQGSWINIVAVGNVELNGSIDTGSSLRVAASGSNGIQINTATITTSGEQVYTSLVTLVDDIIMDSNKHISFSGNITGAHSLTTTVPDGERIVFGGYISSASELIYSSSPSEINISSLIAGEPTSTSDIHLNANITTTEAQTYNGEVTLGGDTTLIAHSGSAGQDITFDSTITGSSHSLTIGNTTNYAETVRFPADITVNALTVVAQNTEFTKTTAQTVTTTSVASITGNMQTATNLVFSNGLNHVLGRVDPTNYHDITLNGNLTANTGSLSLQGNLLLADDITLSANSSGANITLYGNVNKQGGGSAVNPRFATGHLLFASGDTQVINIDGLFTFNGRVTKSAAAQTTITNGFSQSGAGAVSLQGTIVAGNGGLSFAGAITLTGNTTLTAESSGNVTVGNTVSGSGALTVTATNININGDTVTTTANDAVDNPDPTADIPYRSGNQTYNGNVVLGADTTFTINGDSTDTTDEIILFNGAVSSASGNSYNITVTRADALTFNGAISGLQSLTATAGGIAFNATTGDQVSTVTGAVQLNTTGVVSFGNAAGDSVTFGSLAFITNTPSSINLAGTLRTTTSARAISFPSEVALTANSTVTSTNGAITFTGAVTNSVSSTLGVNSGNANITFNNASGNQTTDIDGAVTLTSSGTVTFGNSASDSTSFGSLTFVSNPAVNLAGILATTNNGSAISFPAAVALSQNSEVSSVNADIIFMGALTGSGALTLAVGAGTESIYFNHATPGPQATSVAGVVTLAATTFISFGNDAGDTLFFGSFTITTGTLELAGTIRTTGFQNYNCNIILTKDTTLSAGGAVTFNGTVNSDSGNNWNLTIHGSSAGNNAGAVTFGNDAADTVGGTQLLSSLSVQSSGITINGGAIRTTGAQTYIGRVDLGADTVTLTTTANNTSIAFDGNTSIIEGEENLVIDAGTTGTVTFGGSVGRTTRLNSLAVTAQNINIDGGHVNTIGAQTYSGVVKRNASGAITLISTNILTLNNAVNGNIASFTVTANTININGGSVTSTGNQTYNGEVTRNTGGITLTAQADDTITFGDNISLGTNALTLTAGNLYFTSDSDQTITTSTASFNTFTGNIFIDTIIDASTTHTLTFTNGFTQAASGGAVSLAGAINATYNGLSFAGATTLTGETTLTANNTGNITFTESSSLNTNASALILNAADDIITFGCDISGGSDISLTAGTLAFTGRIPTAPITEQMITADFSAFSGNIQINSGGNEANREITFSNGFTQTGSGSVSLSGTINAQNIGAFSFAGTTTIAANTSLSTSNGNVTFSGAVSSAIATITANGSGNITFAVTSSLTTTGQLTLNAQDDDITFGCDITGSQTFNMVAATLIFTGRAPTRQSIGVSSFNSFTGNIQINTDDSHSIVFTEGFSQNTSGGTVSLRGGIAANNNGLVFNGASTLAGATTLTAVNQEIRFTNTLGGSQEFVISDANVVTFGNMVNIASLSINANTVNINGSAVSTTTSQTYGSGARTGNVVIGNTSTTLRAGNTSEIAFKGSINGSSANTNTLIIGSSGSTVEDVTFTGAIGNTASLASLQVTAGGTVNASSTLTMGTSGILNISANTGMSIAGAVIAGQTTTLRAENGTITFSGTIDGTSNAGTFEITRSVQSTFNGNVGATTPLNTFNVIGSTAVNFTRPVVFGETSDIEATNGGVTFGSTVTGSASAVTRDLEVTSTGTISFGAAVSNFNNITANAGVNVIFNSSVQATGTLSMSASTTGGEGVEFNGNVTAGTFSITNTSDAYIGAASSFNIGTTNINFPRHLYIMAGGSNAVSFNKPLIVGNSFLLRSGAVSLTDSLTTTNGDVVLLGSGYVYSYTNGGETIDYLLTYSLNANFTENQNFRATTSVTMRQTIPSLSTDTDARASISGTITNLAGKTISVGKNFYANSIDLNGVSGNNWTLRLPDNDRASDAFAEARNLDVSYCTVDSKGTFSWVAAAGCTNRGGVNTDVTQNTGWRFLRPTILANDDTKDAFAAGSGTYTVTDDMVRVEFDVSIENTNNEISAVVSSVKFNTGGTYDDADSFAFTGAFINPEGTTSTNDQGDLSVFYLRVSQLAADEEQRWNTDATGGNAGAPDSTDRSGEKRTTVPNIHIPIALNNVYETLRDRFKNRIATVNHTGTADRTAPVLAAVYTGQEAHNQFGAQQPYDAHNFIELRFSEAVDIFGADGTDLTDTSLINEPVTNTFGEIMAPWNNAIRIVGLGSLTMTGRLETGSKDKNTGAITAVDNTVHAFYRRFSVDGTSAIANQTHRVRISIAGYQDGTVLVPGSTTPSNYYPGFIDSATTPSGQINFYGVPDITGADGLDLDTTNRPTVNALLASDPALDGLYGPWDTQKPIIAREDSNDATSLFEAVGIPDGAGSRVLRFEMHLHDNTPTAANSWERGWDGGTVRLDTAGGSRPDYAAVYPALPASPSTQGGLRASTVVGAESAFSIYQLGTNILASDITSDSIQRYVENDYFAEGIDGLATTNDTLYLSFVPTEQLNPFPRYDVQYDSSVGTITDLAGNRMATADISTSDLVAPEITLTLAPYVANNQQLYVYFNKALDLSGIDPIYATLGNIHEALAFNNADGTPSLLIAETGTQIAFQTETATGLIFNLSRPLETNELFSMYFKQNDGAGVVRIRGSNFAPMNTARLSPVTYFGVNTVYPLNAVGALDFDFSTPPTAGDVTVLNFDGSKGLYAHRDITMEVAVENAVAPLDNPLLSPTLWIDSNAVPLTYAERYLEETGQNITFWMPSYTDPASVFSESYNTGATEFTHSSGSDDRYTFTIGTNDIPRASGDTMQFLFEMGTIQTPNAAGQLNVTSSLYHINIPDLDDLQNFSMFAFKVFDETQRGGSTILNNVINVNEKEETLLEVIMPKDGNLNVTVLTADGDVVKVLSRGRKTAGEHYFTWDGTNNAGNAVARGIYFVRIVGPGIDETRKVMAVKE